MQFKFKHNAKSYFFYSKIQDEQEKYERRCIIDGKDGTFAYTEMAEDDSEIPISTYIENHKKRYSDSIFLGSGKVYYTKERV